MKFSQKEIEKQNKKFARMSPSKKRIAIAKDVLMILKLEKVDVNKGTYCSVVNNSKVKDERDLQRNMLNNKASCTVCAMGAIFIAKTRLGNGPIEDFSVCSFDNKIVAVDDYQIISSLKGIFSRQQLRLIECFFEGRDIDVDFEKVRNKDFESLAYEFKNKIDNPKDRLGIIMQNVIDNNGTFKFEQLIKRYELTTESE